MNQFNKKIDKLRSKEEICPFNMKFIIEHILLF
jgi:hypothetical protein